MTFPDSYRVFIWVLFGGMGVTCSITFSCFLWSWVKSCRTPDRSLPQSNASVLGYILLFIGGLMACGIAGPPGYALSDNPALVNREWIMRASFMSLMLSMVGWIFTLWGQIRTLRRTAPTTKPVSEAAFH